MAFFLGVVAVVLLVLVLAALFAFWRFKRWLRLKLSDVERSAAIVDPRWNRPARIQLELDREPEHGEAFDALWARCHVLGFRALADWSERNGAYSALRAARHETLPLGLVLTEDCDAHVTFAMLAMSTANRLTVYSDAQGPALVTSSMTWDVDAAQTPESAFGLLETLANRDRFRDPELRLVEAAYERAWATRMDAQIGTAPQRADLERRAQARGLGAEQVDDALAMEMRAWHAQVSASALDRWRRASRIDAVEWERIRDDVHVVHDGLSTALIRDCVDGEAGMAVFDQLAAQGLTGIALYEQVLERAAPAARHRRLGEVDRPVRAVLYAPPDGVAAGEAAKPHTYAGIADDGREVHGAVFATSSTDARRQLDAMGLPDAKILVEPILGAALPPEIALDPELAAIAAKSAREPFSKQLAGAFWDNKWVWAPPAALVAWSLYEGGPYGWGDWVVFAYAALAAALLLWFIAPMFLYNQLLRARSLGRLRFAGVLLRALAVFNPFGLISKSHLFGERCKIDAARGDLDGALERWRTLEPSIPPDEFAQGLVNIYDSVGDHERMIEAQRIVVARSAAKELASIDLAMSLARTGRQLDEAEALIARTSPQDLSEMALGGYHFVRGLICAERGQTDLALRQFQEALAQFQQYRGNPLMACVIAEISGYSALTLKRAGRREQADALWSAVRELLAVHPSCRRLVASYEGA